mmetsp:Transcript_64838/g.95815  ORF Transcript_64838/g.95815 Transcript_64838/m.95815 type:complete len:330 (-) Transcript_64838:8-997(-)
MNERRNAAYLRVAAQHIGTSCALSYPQREAVQAKKSLMMKNYRRISTKLECYGAISSLRTHAAERKEEVVRQLLPRTNSFHRIEKQMRKSVRSTSRSVTKCSKKFIINTQKRLINAKKKLKGSGLRPPPPAPWNNTAWTFTGSFLTLLTLVTLSNIFYYATSGKYKIVLPPFGALLTLQFGLTASPPAQPRSVIYGQITSGCIALLSQYILLDIFGMKKWFVIPFSAAMSIASMGKLGCPHPPAAAAVIALFCQEGGFNVITILFLLLGNIAAVGCAIVINNLCENRQYPMYWEFGLGIRRSCLGWFQHHTQTKAFVEIEGTSLINNGR